MNFLIDFEQPRLPGLSANVSETRIGHLNLRVADLDRATDFYCDVLGLTVSCYGPAIGLPTVFLAFGNYHHHIALNWFYSDAGRARYTGHSALNHFALVYPDERSLAEAVSRVLQHGASIEDARDHGVTLSVYLRDPDGNGIELYYDRPRPYWFDSNGHLMIKSEPFNVKQWLQCALDYFPEASELVTSNDYMAVMQ
jgi:catechol 2,3-dioxygenase